MLKSFKALIRFIFDLTLLYLTYYISFFIRFEGMINAENHYIFRATVIFPILIYSLIFVMFGVYNRLWRYLSLIDVAHILFSIFFATGVFALMSPLLTAAYSFPRSIIIINATILSLVVLASRFMLRFIREELGDMFFVERKRIIILGAGDAGAFLIQDIKCNAMDKYKIVGLLDDDYSKKGISINGVRVISTIAHLPRIAKRMGIQEVFIAIPSATRSQVDRILGLAKVAGIGVKIIPTTREILDADKVYTNQLKEVSLRDLLGRNPAAIDSEIILKAINGKKILVTGAGGSIGYELCRQVLNFKPAAMMLFERDEMRLFQAIGRLEKGTDTRAVIGDINNENMLEYVLRVFKPDIVFHAAAYKHVPFGEDNPVSYIINNIFGTVNLVNLCDKLSISRFVFISTDKAVEPVNIMGATKRICEEYIRSFSKLSRTSFVMVRFGNVLGSSGSVIETFESQIRDKKPLTVTSKDAKRFFMTIEEAITLSLEAASIGNSSDIYVLDMGQPVKLVDLAKDLLFLSEAVSLPGNNIVFTGLRAGDKIEEKLYAQEETVVKTKYDKLLMVVKKGQPLGQGKFQEWLKQVRATIDNNGPGIKHELEQLLKEILPDYLPYHEYINKINQKDLP